MTGPIVSAVDLAVEYGSGRSRRRVVEGVSFDILPGRTLALVGESGSGKTTIGMAVLGLVPAAAGTLEFDGRNLADLTPAERRALGRERQAVFQDPYSSLDPRKTIGYSLLEPARLHGATRAEATSRAVQLLARVGLDADAMRRYPAQFSGGQRQRIVVARALMTSPRFLVCDEPVSALDLSVQAEVMNLLTSLQRELGLAMLFVSHDLAVVRQISDDIVVLQHGTVVERGPAEDILTNPQDPYTRRLIEAAPRLDRRAPLEPTEKGAPNAHV